ncbi:SDR family oxidoreductase [Ectothiorhodospiraceae bacterium WFHF3C12]|nr:SDR family oxidoreductase [Ectothiorhodospiraceae bacterium WFHF3C12]
MEIRDKVMVVTGAGRGLGRSIALSLAERGARLALLARSEEQLREVAEGCARYGGEARVYPTNVADESQLVGTLAAVVEDLGGLDGMVNNAGITRDGLLVKGKNGEVSEVMSLQDWQAVLDVNLTGVFLGTREAARHMIELGSQGVIVNISSINRAGNLGQGNYSASKAGVAAATVTWAKELARHGIRVAGVAPGYCDTDMVASVPEELKERIIKGIPLRRLGRPEEVAHTVAYVLENDYVTGRVIEVDGGLRI